MEKDAQPATPDAIAKYLRDSGGGGPGSGRGPEDDRSFLVRLFNDVRDWSREKRRQAEFKLKMHGEGSFPLPLVAFRKVAGFQTAASAVLVNCTPKAPEFRMPM